MHFKQNERLEEFLMVLLEQSRVIARNTSDPHAILLVDQDGIAHQLTITELPDLANPPASILPR